MAVTTAIRAVEALLLISLLGFASAQKERTINVAGTGTATAPPDLATISTSVVTTAATAMEALDDNSKALSNILDVLKDKGVAENDIQTTLFNVNPQFEPSQNGQQRNNIIGYRVTNQLQVRLRDIDILGEILDALVTAGSNRISSVSFSIADPKPLQNQARRAAVEDATSRAKLYAEAARVTLGKIISISEQSISLPSPKSSQLAGPAVARSVPIATGELDISATVFMLFQIA